MQYTYFRSRDCDKDDRDRRRASLIALLYVRFHLPIRTLVCIRPLFDRTYQVILVERLLRQLGNRDGQWDPQLINWIFSYSRPGVLRAVIRALGESRSFLWPHSVLKRANPKLLLAREYLTPEFQRIQTSTGYPRTVLVCFTGMAQRLNMPVQLFHSAVAERFDVLLYLRDFERQRFIYGVPGLGRDIRELTASLRHYIPEDCHLSVLATSGGGIAATRVADELKADRLALFSPAYRFKHISAISGRTTLNNNNALVYLAAHHQQDRKLADEWRRTVLEPSIRWLDTDSHGTLSYLATAGRLEEVITWLLGGDSPALDHLHTGQRVAAGRLHAAESD